MSAPDLLRHLRDAGFAVTAADGGGIRVAPAGALTDDHRQAIRDHRAELLSLLAAPPQPAADPDRWCWPHSDAMNSTELAEFANRAKQFTRQGVSADDAEVLADIAPWPVCEKRDPQDAPAERRSGNPFMTPEQADECHATPWDDAEIEAFTGRVLLFASRGRRDAEHLAELCCLRDRRHDDLRLCLECTHLKRGVCSNWAAAGFTKSETVLLDTMQRCSGFEPAEVSR